MTSTIEAGRVRTPAERREQLLVEFERSGLSGSKFAALVGIKYSTFAGWVIRRRKQHGSASVAVKSVDSVRWLQAVEEQLLMTYGMFESSDGFVRWKGVTDSTSGFVDCSFI